MAYRGGGDYYGGYDPYGQPIYEDDLPQDPPVPGVPPQQMPDPPPTDPQAPAPPAEPEAPAPSDPWDTGPSDGNWQAWFLRNVSSLSPSPTTLESLRPKLAKHGIAVLTNASGIAGKIMLPSGQIVDVGRAFSSGNPGQMGWTWDIGGGSEGGGGAEFSGEGIDPTFLEPFTQPPPAPPTPTPFTAPPDAALPTFERPGDFNAPTGETITQDPSFLFRMEQGQKALENSAAARGVLNSGGTLSDILNYGQKAASQEYSNVWDRAFGSWNADWRNALSEYDARLNKANISHDNAFGVWDTTFGHQNQSYNNLWRQYVEAKDTWYRNQNEPFNKMFKVSSLGATAAGA